MPKSLRRWIWQHRTMDSPSRNCPHAQMRTASTAFLHRARLPRPIRCSTGDIVVISHYQRQGLQILWLVARKVDIAVLAVRHREAIINQAGVCSSKPADTHCFHSACTAIVAYVHTRQTMQGIGNVGNATAEHGFGTESIFRDRCQDSGPGSESPHFHLAKPFHTVDTGCVRPESGNCRNKRTKCRCRRQHTIYVR